MLTLLTAAREGDIGAARASLASGADNLLESACEALHRGHSLLAWYLWEHTPSDSFLNGKKPTLTERRQLSQALALLSLETAFSRLLPDQAFLCRAQAILSRTWKRAGHDELAREHAEASLSFAELTSSRDETRFFAYLFNAQAFDLSKGREMLRQAMDLPGRSQERLDGRRRLLKSFTEEDRIAGYFREKLLMRLFPEAWRWRFQLADPLDSEAIVRGALERLFSPPPSPRLELRHRLASLLTLEERMLTGRFPDSEGLRAQTRKALGKFGDLRQGSSFQHPLELCQGFLLSSLLGRLGENEGAVLWLNRCMEHFRESPAPEFPAAIMDPCLCALLAIRQQPPDSRPRFLGPAVETLLSLLTQRLPGRYSANAPRERPGRRTHLPSRGLLTVFMDLAGETAVLEKLNLCDFF